MLTKFAKAEVLGVRSTPTRVRSASLTKFADFNEYRTDDGYVYVRVRAISSRVNKNHDGWPSEELQKSYRTFIGKPIFVDHHNSDPKKARGVIVDAQLHIEDGKTSSLDSYYSNEGVDPTHLPPTWVELLLEVDAKKFPKLAKAIVAGDIDGVSMGANVESSVCSHCGNTAHTPEEFCKHIVSKGAYFDYTQPNGLKVSKKSYENCHGVGFFEISFVFDPADETALASEIITTRRARVAAIHAEAALDLPDPGMEEMQVPDPPVGDEEYVPNTSSSEAEQVMNWRMKQLLEMGMPEGIASELAQQEYRGEGKGVDLSQLRSLIDQGAAPEQAARILSKTANKYIKQQGGKWVIIQKGTGKVLSEHDSEEKANASFRAMEMHKHEGASIPPASGLEYYTPDEVAETLPISRETGIKLWDILGQMEQAGKAAPIGGDRHDPQGEFGTPMVEDPGSRNDIVSGGRGNVVSIWDQLSPQEQQEINDAYQKEWGDYDTGVGGQGMENQYPHDEPNSLGDLGSYGASTKTAEDRQQNPLPQSLMTSAPDKVDTLRQEQVCPICGSDMNEGECDVCNYVQPPEGFDNPDLNKAKETDQQIEDQQAEQAMQQTQPPAGPGGGPPPGPGSAAAGMPPSPGGSPALSSFFHMPVTTTGNVTTTPVVMGESKISATTNSGRINTQERPILPATRQLSDKPLSQKVIQEAKQPVESKTKDKMTQTQKTADGVQPADSAGDEKRVDVLGIGGVDSDVDADNRVDVEGVGAVSGDPLSDIEHENVEKNTGDFTAPHTDTWNGNKGDSLGQQDAVTSETGDFFTVSAVVKPYGDKFVVIEKGTGKVLASADSEAEANQKLADSSADLGGPIGEGVKGGDAKEGGPTWDASDAGFPDHKPARVDLDAPLKEETGAGTQTDPNEEFRSLKHADPITSENANSLGGPIGVAVAHAKAVQLKAFKLAETEIELGITDAEGKYDRVAELEGHSEDALDAQLSTLAKVRTAGLKKSATKQQKIAGRMPSLRPVTGSFEIEAHGVSDQEIEDSLW